MDETKYIALMIFVTAVLFIRLFFNRSNKKHKPILYYILNTACIIFFMVYFSFRFIYAKEDFNLGGVDSIVYKTRFENATGNFVAALKMQEYEYGYGTFVYLIRLITNNYAVFELIYYAIIFTMIFYIIDSMNMKMNVMSFVLLFVYIVIPLFDSMNIARNILGYFISFCAFIKYSKGKKKTAWLLALIAISVHFSGFLIIPTLILYHLVKNNKSDRPIPMVYFGILIISILAIFAAIYALQSILASTKYIHYFTTSNSGFPLGLMLERFAALGLYIILAIKVKCDDKLSKIGLLLLMFGIAVTFLQVRLPILYRINTICGIGCFIVFNNINNNYKTSKPQHIAFNRIFLSAIMIALFAFKINSILTDTISSYGLLPHYYIWETSKIGEYKV